MRHFKENVELLESKRLLLSAAIKYYNEEYRKTGKSRYLLLAKDAIKGATELVKQTLKVVTYENREKDL